MSTPDIPAQPSALRVGGKLLIELLAIVAVLATAAILIYVFTRPPHVHNARAIGGPQFDVSRDVRPQREVSAALDPTDPRRILAASGDQLQNVRVYESEDGGTTWTSRLGPPLLRANCDHDDPSVAIDGGGRQYVAFLAQSDCRLFEPHVWVGVRSGGGAKWLVRPVERVRKGAFAYDDLPALAADPRRPGRAYAVWTRLEHRYGKLQSVSAVTFSRTVDGGRTWSAPARLGAGHNYAAALAVARSGDVYLALAREGELVLRRSRDGGRTWSGARQVGVLPGPFFAGCARGNAFLPAVPRTCVGVSPGVVVLPGGGPFVTWAAPDADGTHAVWAARFDASLHPLESGRVGPRDPKPADQFGPAAAVDATTGAVWVCYYDTTGDPQRKRTWYTCTASRDGGRSWGVPVRAAATRSDETKISAGLFAYGDRQAVVAARGVAHPLWTDGRRLLPDAEEIYATSIPLSRVR